MSMSGVRRQKWRDDSIFLCGRPRMMHICAADVNDHRAILTIDTVTLARSANRQLHVLACNRRIPEPLAHFWPERHIEVAQWRAEVGARDPRHLWRRCG